MERPESLPTDYHIPDGWEAGSGERGSGSYTHRFAYYDDENAEYFEMEVYSDGEAGGNDHHAILRATKRMYNGDVVGDTVESSHTINADDVGGHVAAQRLIHTHALDMMAAVTDGEHDYSFDPWWEQCDHAYYPTSETEIGWWSETDGVVRVDYTCDGCGSGVTEYHELGDPGEQEIERPDDTPF